MFTYTTINIKSNMNIYYVWIFTMFSMEDILISSLAKKSYKVSSSAQGGQFTISEKTNPAVCINFQLEHLKNDKASLVLDDVRSILKDNKILYYGLVVTEQVGKACWHIGNIVLPKDILPSGSVQE